MARNIILIVATAGILVVLFLGYRMLMQDPVTTTADRTTAQPVPSAPADEGGAVIELGQDRRANLPPGGAVDVVIYDSRTGRPTGRFGFSDWRKAPDRANAILVTAPRMTMLMPSGQITHVSADEGDITIERDRGDQIQPRSGRLYGAARITIDRETAAERAPDTERPDDFFTIELGELFFDVAAGLLRSDGPVRVVNPQVELTSGGLDFVWNATDDRLESLRLSGGGTLRLNRGSDLLSGLGRTPAEPAAQPDAPAAPAPQRPRVGYLCTLDGGVVAEQYQADQIVAGLSAPRIRLVFDVASRTRPTAAEPGPAASADGPATQDAGDATDTAPADDTVPNADAAPTTAPAEPPGHLIVRWEGGFTITPQDAARTGRARRHFVAEDGDVRLFRGPQVVECGRLELRDESQQIWLSPRADGLVRFDLGRDVVAEAGSAYVDTDRNVVKLVGAVALHERDRAGSTRGMSIRCGQWAELLLAGREAPDTTAANTLPLADDPLGASGGLRSATFVGDVAIGMGAQRLSAESVTARFRPGGEGESLERLLDGVTAEGSVRLIERRDAWPRLVADVLAAGLQTSFGAHRGTAPGVQQQLECAALDATFAPDAVDEIRLRAVTARGAVFLLDRGAPLAVRGRALQADFDAEGRVALATITGQGGQPAYVHAPPFVVRGETVRVDPAAQSLAVPDTARLAFDSATGLQGRRHDRPRRIRVTASDGLRVSGPDNLVHFDGDVVAAAGDERLRAHGMTLHLADTPPPPATTTGWTRTLAPLMTALGSGDADRPTRLTAAAPAPSSTRKEAVRLVAEQAVVESESYRIGDPQPVVHSSLAAPRLDVDIPARVIRTTGATTLLMTNRQADPGGEEREGGALGVPSGLMTRGPSQTAIACSESMTYAIGADEDRRHDFVVFEGDVQFVHLAGREMVNLDQMLPELAADPDKLAALRSRNTRMTSQRVECEFRAVEGAARLRRDRQAAGPPLRLSQIVSSGSVFLIDRQGPSAREVHADRIEYDSNAGLVRVFGSDRADARVYMSNAAEGTFSTPATGRQLEINLRTDTVRAPEGVEGEIRRAVGPSRP